VSDYWPGVFAALLSGLLNNLGVLLQKKAINELPEGRKVGRHLLRNSLWLLGFTLNIPVTAVFAFIAVYLIGPTLVPGLQGSGLIALAIGSLTMLHEHIGTREVLGILLMVAGTFALAFSGLSISVSEYGDLESMGFMTRAVVFTGLFLLGSLFCHLLRRTDSAFRGVLYAVDSGFMFVISNFWMSPFIGVFPRVLSGTFAIAEFVLFALSVVILPLTTYLGIFTMQKSLEFGQASNVRPIQQAPIQIAPIFYYLSIFMLEPPEPISLPLGALGVSLTLLSTFLLSRGRMSLGQRRQQAAEGRP